MSSTSRKTGKPDVLEDATTSDAAPDGSRSTVADFSVTYTRFLDKDGNATGSLPAFAEDAQNLIAMYRAMVLARTFDAKAIALQRTGRLGTFASALGQEAVGVGVAAAMRPEDVLLPSFREHAAQLWRGVTLTELLVLWGGDERGSNFADPREDFPVCVPVASHASHAAGVALAFQLRAEPRAAVCICGDGATSKGDFYEAINLAGVWTLPVVFVVNNNQWAISVPRAAQSAAQTLAQKAIAAGIPGLQVDGNDIVAVHHAAQEVLTRARGGGGPTLIEAITYRLGDHTTADDASRYRDDAEVSRHWEKEPVQRLRSHLVGRDAWSKADEESLLEDCARRVDVAVDEYEKTAPQAAATMFDSLYATLPDDLAAQRAEVIGETEDG